VRYAPEYPDEFPVQMSLYHWFAEVYNWVPRDVDELTLEQLFWFPVMREARADASEQYND
jgi:hypothetical protein